MADSELLHDRLSQAFAQIRELLDICRVPSISVGVLRHGKVVFTRSVGRRVVGRGLGATPETAYLIDSCSKIFLTCAVGILVDEGKMSWHDPIRNHVPDFHAEGDERISQGATIRHALCHTTGLGRQNPLIRGIEGSMLVDEDGFVEMVNHAQTHDAEQCQFRHAEYDTASNAGNAPGIHQDAVVGNSANDNFQDRRLAHNNYSMALVGLAVQNASGQRYSTFIQERILDPLGMNDTIVTQRGMESCQNVAVGYVKLRDETFSEVATESQTDDAHTPMLSVIGVRSSVNDMLTLTKAMTSAFWCGYGRPEWYEQNRFVNPLRQLSTIWTSWVEFEQGLSRGLGGYKVAFPSESFNGFGMNNRTRNQEPELFENHFMGRTR